MAWKFLERFIRQPQRPEQTTPQPPEPKPDASERQRVRNARQWHAPGRTRLPARFYGEEPDGPDAA